MEFIGCLLFIAAEFVSSPMYFCMAGCLKEVFYLTGD